MCEKNPKENDKELKNVISKRMASQIEFTDRLFAAYFPFPKGLQSCVLNEPGNDCTPGKLMYCLLTV